MSSKNFTIYKSSAGSGKTFTLVKEYLAIALNDEANPPQAYRHILAITFTNKAAAEMKERIIKALKELSSSDYEHLSSNSKNLLLALKAHKKLNQKQVLDDGTIRERANNVLTAVLHNYSDFAIGTIDSFVHKIVRTFAFDLKIPMSFDLEMDDEKLLTQAIDLLIAKIGTDEKLTKALIDFTESKADDEKSWHIENELKYFAKNLLNESGAVYVDKLKSLTVDDFFSIKDALQKNIKSFESAIVSEAQKATDVIKKSGLTAKTFYYGDKGIAAYFQNLANRKFDKIKPNSYVMKTVGDDKWEGGKISKEELSAIESIKSNLLDCFNQIQIIKDKDYADYVLFTMIASNIYSLAVLNEIEKLLVEYKSENNILHISEFNKMIAKVVLNEPVPFIYERLGEKYHNYLIDEFQDTSVLQFQNLLPLIDNSLATGQFTMLVGDGKQAIYRWRGGEVEQFSVLPKVFKHNDNPLLLERQDALGRNYNPEVLNKNFRSKKEIIQFNNELFRTLANTLHDKYRPIYETLEQEFNADNTGGFVKTEFLVGEKEELREANFKRTLEIIQDLQKQNFDLKEIAILVRKNSDGSEIANYLSKNNIPVISSDSLLLSNSAEVNFIHAILNFINNSNDSIVQAEISEYLIASKLLPNSLLDEVLKKKTKKEYLDLLQQAAPDFNVYILSKMPLYELSEELVRIFKLNKSPNAYIQFYLDEVLNYSIKQNNNLSDFIEHWNDKKGKASLIVPQGMNAVNIMTIHRSKGLEFPAVILPFMNGKIEPGNKHLWLDLQNESLPNFPAAIVSTSQLLKETKYADVYEEEKSKSLLDILNVLYVAFTRAEERMYVLSTTPSKSKEGLNTIPDMLAHHYQTKGEWKDDIATYTSGNESKHIKHEQTVVALNFKLETFNSNQWRESIKMRTAAPTIWNTDMAETKKSYGVMVHTALARIKNEEDVNDAVLSMFSEGLINEEEKQHLLETIHSILALPDLKKYFEKGLIIKNESEIILQNGEMFRPDRTVINGKNAVLIDYKTGKPKAKDESQIQNYGLILSEMGYTVSERLLVYIEEAKVVKC